MGRNLSVINVTDNEREFKFIDLVNDEEIYVDNENQIIITDLIDMYRYDNHNDTWLCMLRGTNDLIVIGGAQIEFKWRCKFIQG